MILDWAAFFKTLNYFKTYTFNIFTVGPLVATIFTFMNLNAAQFAIAHEIMHKPGKFYRCLATAHMFKLGYMHFTHHHLYNHHFKVATPEDPSSAQKGDNVYSFFIQCVKGSWQGVYKQEQK